MSDDPIDHMWNQLLSEPRDAPPEKNFEKTLTEKESSTVSWVSFSQKKLTLIICFRSSPGVRYVYYGVPKEVGNDLFQAIKEGKSPGRYLRSKIQGNYSFLKERTDKAP